MLLSLLICIVFYKSGYTQNIQMSVCKGNIERLDSMLTSTIIDVKDNRDRSLLHWAVACKQKKVFDFLLTKGIKINEADNQQKTPLHVAVQFNNTEYFEYLVTAQPNKDWIANYGPSLLELAVLNGNKELIEKLISNGTDLNVRNYRGSTVLEISKRLDLEDISAYLISQGADDSLVRTFEMKGNYMGLKEPGTTPILFAPNFISTEEEEFGSVFNSEATEFYFGVDIGKRNEIRYSKMKGGKWTKPKTIVADEKYSYNDPFLSNDENRLYFISTRALDGSGETKDIDIWYVERLGDEWSEPIHTGSNINTTGDEYYISFTDNGTIYFASDGHMRKDSSRTDHDIYYAKIIDTVFQEPILLDTTINTTGYEADVFVAPDESYLIFCSTRKGSFGSGDLYISFKNSDGSWGRALNMGEDINTKDYEYCPFVTKDGKYLFYTSNQDIYWVSTEIIDRIKSESGY